MSEWGDFSSMDDDDDVDVDAAASVIKEYAKEEDTQERKAQVGGLLQAPTVENDADPMFVPLGKCNNVGLYFIDIQVLRGELDSI